jgi:protein-disulfide isomerase
VFVHFAVQACDHLLIQIGVKNKLIRSLLLLQDYIVKKLSLIAAAVSAVFFVVAIPAKAAPLTPEQQDNLVKIQSVLEQKPELIDGLLTSLNMYIDQENKTAVTLKKYHDWLYNNPDLAAFGTDNPKLTIVNFTDFNCPYCKRLDPVLQRLTEENPEVRVVNVFVPLQQREVAGIDTNSAQYALNVWKNDPDGYMKVHDYLIRKNGRHDKSSLERVAQVTKTQMLLDVSNTLKPTIDKSYQIFSELGLNGTPAMLIGDQILPGYLPYDQLKPIVEDALKKLS